MQTTESLIRQYSHTRKGQMLAPRLFSIIRKRARRGDELARRFLDHQFTPGSMANIQRQVARFFAEDPND